MEFAFECFPKINPAPRLVLVTLSPAYSGFSSFFKQKKQICGFPDARVMVTDERIL